jgi:copper homeostasis protein
MKILKECCVETLEQAIRAAQNGADRVELCGDLSVGGITPSRQLTQAVQNAISIPIMVMVRPRGGNFVYDGRELAQMESEIHWFRQVEVAGVVFGCLTADHQIDMVNTTRLAALAKPLLVTFHKAIDETPDPVAAAHQLSQIPDIQRILTSGGHPTALAGKETLRQMITQVAPKLTIVAAGKVTKDNLEMVHQAIGATEYHGRLIV